ncbi:MAG: protein kinase [Verrucomicrobiales bacterium]|nr:protein kinase [Verrucomicrobiales bacterium]
MKLPELPDYRYDELIGEGACGLAVRCTFQERETRVVKFLKAQSINPGLVGTCLRTLTSKERHPGLADVYGYNLTEYPYYYISPYYGQRDGKTGEWHSHSLEDHLGTLPAPQAMRLIDQIAEAVAFAHRQEVIHAGLKPSNIFLTGHDPDQWQIKITDWGQGYLTGLQYLEMGSLGFFASPEQLDSGDPSHGAGKRWDVYAFGVTAYLLLTGRLPRLEAQYQSHLREIQGFSHRPAAAFGTVLDQPERYVDWIVEEEKILWPNPPADEGEERRRKIIDRCLAVDPRDRYPDMRDVVAAFAECDHHLAILEMEKKAAEGRHRVLKRAARWQQAAVGAGAVSLVGAIAAAIFFAEWRMAKNAINVTEAGAQQQEARIQTTLIQTAAEKEKAKKQLDALRNKSQEVIEKEKAKTEEIRESLLEQMRQARQLVVASQDNGDRFFELVLETRDSDVPGFAEARRNALGEAAAYYQNLLQLYGTAPDFVESSAKAARFLGEIHFELGDYGRAESDFLTARLRLEQARSGSTPRPDVVRALAMVNSRLAEIARARNQPDAGLLALDEAIKLWVSVSSAEPTNPEPALRIADARILQADFHRAGRDFTAARTALQEALRIFLALKQQSPRDHRVVGGLARTTAATADLMRLSGATEGVKETYHQAAELFADAVQLNGAVADYQYGLATTLAEVALDEDNLEKLTASAKVLAEIAAKPENRHRTEVFTSLSECYGALAQKQRDGNQAASALDWEHKAIAVLEPLVNGNGSGQSAPDELRYALARRKSSLADLQVDRNEVTAARTTLGEADQLIQKLLEVDGTNAEYRRLYAQIQGQVGYLLAQSGDKAAARGAFENARKTWEAYLQANPKDTQASQALEWSKNQIDGLK